MTVPGKIRAGQLVGSFGPGAIFDVENDSVMIMGLEKWHDTPANRLNEPVLENLLGVSYFVIPPSSGDDGFDIPCISFPKYRECEKCGKLSNDFSRKGTIHYCNKPGCNGKTHPARFITACTKGHIDDFPWMEWAHDGKETCSKPELKIRTSGFTSSLSAIKIECSCGSSRNMGSAMSDEALSRLGIKCSGKSPWLNKEASCCENPVTLQRGASNVYFPLNFSAISVPPWTKPINRRISELVHSWPKDQLREQKSVWVKFLKSNPLLASFTEIEIEKALDLYLEGETVDELSQIKKMEWKNFMAHQQYNDELFSIEEEEVPLSFKPFLEKTVLVKRIREVRCLTGFLRIDPGDPEMGEEGLPDSYNRLSKDRTNWLPAVEVFGEGVFLSLDNQLIQNWENRKIIKDKMQNLNEIYSNWRQERSLTPSPRVSAKFVLLHSLAHLLIRELSVSCGYSAASLRERIYCDKEMASILIYTASGDSEGSLGGLVQQGKKQNLEELLNRAIKSAQICTNDPLCSDIETGFTGTVNGAACHSCSYVSETSCENSNRLLDRSLVVDIDENSRTGFFSAIKPPTSETGEDLNHITETGILVRSKSEVIIANMLSKFSTRGLRFIYEAPLPARTFEEETPGSLHPDFTIEFNDKTYYWEHLGRTGDPNYMEKWRKKERWYKKNGYINQLIVSMDEENGTIDARKIREKIEGILQDK